MSRFKAAVAASLPHLKKGFDAYMRPFRKAAAYFEAKDYPSSAFAMKAAAFIPLAALASLPLSFGVIAAVGALSHVTLGIAATSIVASTAGLMAYITGINIAQESAEHYFGKRKIKTITNDAGQTVTGTAFDLSRLRALEPRISALSTRLLACDTPLETQEVTTRLQAAFEKAAPYIARVTVIKYPANENAADATYAFAKRHTTVTTSVSRISV